MERASVDNIDHFPLHDTNHNSIDLPNFDDKIIDNFATEIGTAN